MGHLTGITMDWKWAGSGPEVDQKWNARDIQAQGACTLRLLNYQINPNKSIHETGKTGKLHILQKYQILFCGFWMFPRVYIFSPLN